MPVPYHPYSFSYVIEDDAGAIHIIDLGWPTLENERVLDAALDGIGWSIGDVATVIGTHMHSDHVGMAESICARSGAPLLLHAADDEAAVDIVTTAWSGVDDILLGEWGVPVERRAELATREPTESAPRRAEVLLGDGQLLPIPGRSLEVIHTPGHTAGHICVFDRDAALLFSGDHLLPTIHPGIGLGGPTASNPLADYLASLDRIAALGDVDACPGHEYAFHSAADRCLSTSFHHLRRSREVAAILEEAPDLTVWAVATRLSWTAGWANLHDHYLQSALAQTRMHIDFVRSDISARYL